MKTTEKYTAEKWLFTIEEQEHGFGLHYLILGRWMSTQTDEQRAYRISRDRTELMHAQYSKRDAKRSQKGVITLDAVVRGVQTTLTIPKKAPPVVKDAAFNYDNPDRFYARKILLQLAVQEIGYLATEGPSRDVPERWAVRGTRLWFKKGECTKEEYADKAFEYNPILEPLRRVKIR